MTRIENLSRRDVVKGIALGSGLVLGFHVGLRPYPVAAAGAPAAITPNVYLSIDETGVVTIVAHRSEMGTGIKTGLPMVLADELGADWNRIKVVQADGDAKYGDQNTDGSRSMRQFYQPMREAGAAARQMLEDAAAHVWGVDAKDCRVRNHVVVHIPTGRQLGFGDLVKVAAQMEVPSGDHVEFRFNAPGARRFHFTVEPMKESLSLFLRRPRLSLEPFHRAIAKGACPRSCRTPLMTLNLCFAASSARKPGSRR